jgi:hypothetical protein
LALERREDGSRWFQPIHKRRYLEPIQIEEAVAESEWIRDLFGDLALELTRAANWIFDEVRFVVDPRYQSDLGVLMIEREEGLGSSYYRARYKPDEIEAEDYPYRGLSDFIDARASRDWAIGSGLNREGYRLMTPYPWDDLGEVKSD